MGYQAGVDLGTTYTAAAIQRDGRVEMVWLGERAAVIPSVVFIKPDGSVLTGEAATRQASIEPTRAAREFKRRIGDRVSLLVGGMPYSADVLTARLLDSVLQRITEREGGPPDALAITHPANWGPFKLDLLQQAVVHAGVSGMPVTYLTEPQAAAIHYATQERVEPGSVIAVYDLGGGTFDAAVLRRTDSGGYEILGDPTGIERLGGIDFDAAVFAHVDRAVGGALSEVDPDDEEAAVDLARLWAECIDAKEVLSSDVDVAIPVTVAGARRSIRLTRQEFEAMIRPAVGETIVALRRVLRSADVAPDDLQAVLLVGGSSRVPVVAELVSSELGRPVAVDAHPKHGIALGAAAAAAQEVEAARADTLTVVPSSEAETEPSPAPPPPVPPVPPVPPSPPPSTARDVGEPASEPDYVTVDVEQPKRGRLAVAIAAVALVVVGAIAAFALASGGGGGGDDEDGPEQVEPAGRTFDGVLDKGDVWAASVAGSGAVVKIDRDSGDPVTSVAVPGVGEEPVVGDEIVWLVSADDEGVVVSQIDRDEGELIRDTPIPVDGAGPFSVELVRFGEGAWVLVVPVPPSTATPVAVRLSEDGAIATQAPLGTAAPYIEPVVDGERLFVSQLTGAARVDLDGRVTAGAVPGLERRRGLAAADGRVFVIDNDAVVELDPETMAVRATTPYTDDEGPATLFDANRTVGLEIEVVYGSPTALSFIAGGPEVEGTLFFTIDATTGAILTRSEIPGQQAAGTFDLRQTDVDTFWAYLGEAEPALLRIGDDGEITEFGMPERGTGDPDLVTNGGRLVVSDVDVDGDPVAYVVDPETGEIETTVDELP